MSNQITVNDSINASGSYFAQIANDKSENPFAPIEFEVVSEPIFFGDSQGNQFPVPNHKAIVRKDKNLVLSVMKGSYEIIQGARVRECIESSLAGIPYTVEGCGTYGNSRKFFVCISIEGAKDYLVNGDQFKNYLIFVCSHDGTISLELLDSCSRMACMNQLRVMRKNADIHLKVYHTKNSELKIQNMEKTIESILIQRESFFVHMKDLASVPMSAEQANLILSGWLATDKLSTRGENQKERILELFDHGKGNKGETAYDLLNGVTEYYTHESAPEEKQFASSEFGSAAKKKEEFFEFVINDDLLNKLAQKGEAMLAKRERELSRQNA
jgi:phage/plasmid-like protein (TIGR03299 family)